MNALPLPVALADVLARGDVWRGDTLASLPEATIPSGYPELDAELPGGGWPRGGLSEFLVERSSVGELSLLLPALACLSRDGHDVVGVDIEPAKLELIKSGKTPVVEEGMVE